VATVLPITTVPAVPAAVPTSIVIPPEFPEVVVVPVLIDKLGESSLVELLV
jgi:hypothetical protein